jgi:AI-2 transport protein TqsA
VRAAPLWALPRGLIVLLGLAAGVSAAAGIQVMAWLVGPLFLALTIVICVSPLQAWLRRHGFPRWTATLVLVLVVYAVLLGIVAVVMVSVARLATELPRYAARVDEMIAAATDSWPGSASGGSSWGRRRSRSTGNGSPRW